MNLIKRIAGMLAMSLLVTQMLGVGTAFASSGETDDCDAGSTDLEVTIGDSTVELYVDGDWLVCYTYESGYQSIALNKVKSVAVEMDDEDDSDGSLWIYLDDKDTSGEAAVWPKLDTFDLDVTTAVVIDGDEVDAGAGNVLRINVGAKTFSFNGTSGTSNAPAYDINGGSLNDLIDGTGATAKLDIDGGYGNDTLKGGNNRDDIYGDYGFDTIYGGPGNDSIDCDYDAEIDEKTKMEYGWGGPGDDYIEDCSVVAPGTGDDFTFGGDTDSLLIITYADVTGGVEVTLDSTYYASSEVITGGAAGDDTFEAGYVVGIQGGQGDDVLVDFSSLEIASGVFGTVKGLGGDDVIKTVTPKAYGGDGNDLIVDLAGIDSKFYGEGGADVLRGKGGDDKLYGGNGKDQGWGSSGEDLCRAEVTNRCEFFGGKRQ